MTGRGAGETASAGSTAGLGARRSALGSAIGSAIGIAIGAAVVRLAMAAIIAPMPDESYYWEWSRRLASGYFDHPPAIAIAIRAGTAVFGVSAFGIRFVPVVLGLVAVLAAIELARRVAGDRAALRASAVLACVPLAGAGLVLATPDVPLLCSGALALLCVERATAGHGSRRGALLWWALAGLACGGAMASKFTGVLLPASLLVALVAVPPLRRHLATPGPYLAVALASLVMLPVLRWNAQHDWISFRFQLQHGLGTVTGAGLKREGELLGGQLALVTPILLVMLAIAVARGLRARDDARRRMLAIVSALTVLFFVWSAWRRPAEANWPAPAYIPAIALLAAHEGSVAWKRWLAAGCALGALLVALTYAQSVYPVIPIAARRDPTARNAGFRELAARVAAVRDSLRRGGDSVGIAAQKYQDASELAFWLPDHPEVMSINIGSRPNQYDLWPALRERARPGSDLVFVAAADDSLGATNPGLRLLAPYYQRVTRLDVVPLARGGSVREGKRIWLFGSLNSPLP